MGPPKADVWNGSDHLSHAKMRERIGLKGSCVALARGGAGTDCVT